MKPRHLRIRSRSLATCTLPLLLCASLQAKVVMTNETATSNSWTLPSGTNLLAGTVPTTAPPVTHEGSSNIWGTLTDGSIGGTSPTTATSVTPNNTNEVVFPLDLTSKPGGYDITSFDSYCTWGDSGRDNQNYTLQYSTVTNPTTFVTIGAVDNRTGSHKSTHTRLTDDTGCLAKGVHSIKVIFANNQENGYTGFREFVLQDTPTVPCVMTEANDNNAFFVPGGTNLLAGLTPVEAAPAVHEGSSAGWATVTDGSLGDYNSPASSVTPNNGNTLTYPLDLTNHPAGRTIHSFDSFCAWGSNGRDDQNYVLSYSTVSDPGTFIPITAVAANTEFNGPNARRATHARVTANGTALATGVHSIRLTFQNQENGYTGFREFFLSDTPIAQTNYEANQTNSWTLPVGGNLLSTAVSIDPSFVANANHGNGDVTSSDWAVLTDGSAGSAGTQLQSAAPLNNTSVVYTLDTSVNTLGYKITSFDAYAAWGDTGRDNQDFTILYSTVSDPGTFHPIETIANHTNYPVNATHSRVAPATGVLASNVGAIKFYFNNQENGYVGYREFIVQGSAVPLFSPLTWTGLSGSAGSATWIAGPDNNWSDGTGSSPFNTLAPLTFDDSGNNTYISLTAPITADSLTFSNNTKSYTFVGSDLTVSNALDLTGSGSATFANPVIGSGVAVSGAGTLTLAADNTLNGSSTVNNGVLVLSTDAALGNSSLAMTAGAAQFTSANPTVKSISGTAGTIYLGNTTTGTDSALTVGDSTSATFAGSITDGSPTANGSLIKAGTGNLTLTGTNTYTGTTAVSDGVLTLGKRLALYNGNPAAWTSANLIVNTDLTLRVGGAGEFTSSDVAAIQTGGFATGAILGLDTTSGDFEITDPITGNLALEKKGLNSLTLSGTNTFTQGIAVDQGALYAANPSGISIPGDLTVGNITFDVFANMAYDNQFGPDSLLKFLTGAGAVNGKLQMRGTSQTVAGLVSGSINRVAVIQNDETMAPGYTSNPGPCTLTVNVAAEAEHSFRGIIRNQDGGALTLIKTGPGTQELVNTTAQGYGYNGPTLVDEGTFRINFAGGNNDFASDITVASGATMEFVANGGNYNFNRIISGDGNIVVRGSNAIIFTNKYNSFTHGVTVGVGPNNGFLALSNTNGAIGGGTGPGQFCVAGAMDPANVITVNGGATLSIDNVAALGESTVLPEFAPSVRINEGSRLFGGTNTVAFVSNITLDGGTIEITNGANHGAFDTDLTFVGTLVVGGNSPLPSLIHTTGTGPYANASLGSAGLPGTTFQVADVTSSADPDLTVTSVLRDVATYPSPLVKTGPGTMALEGANTYTGPTTVSAGVLVVNGGAIADANSVVIDGGKLGIAATANETVSALYYGGIQQIAGTYGSSTSSATFKDDTRFTGDGILTVTTGPVTDPFIGWASVIPNPDDRDREDDPDGDGFTNLEEFLFGTSPIASTASLTTSGKSGGFLIVRWCERASATYVLEESSTLQSPWPASAVVPADAADQSGLYSADYVRKEAQIPVDSAAKFVRVQATE